MTTDLSISKKTWMEMILKDINSTSLNENILLDKNERDINSTSLNKNILLDKNGQRMIINMMDPTWTSLGHVSQPQILEIKT